jgi:hypothetical protein
MYISEESTAPGIEFYADFLVVSRYVSIRQHTSAYVSIRMLTSGHVC